MAKIMIIATGAMMVYHHRLELINRLRLCGMDVIVAAPEAPEAAKLRELGCRFIDTPLDTRGKNLLKDLDLCHRLIRTIRREQPDAVLTFYTKTNIYGAIAAQWEGVPYITNITGMGSAIENGGLMQRVMLILYRLAVRKASCLFFQNQYNLDFFASHNIRRGSGRLIPGSGVSLERFHPLPYPQEDLKPEFVFISRILKEKGIDQYIDAAKDITKNYPGTVFHVIGPCGKDYADILDSLDKNGTIRYHGKQFDVRPYIERSHCVVFPSYYSEGMANVLLEGAACGRPLITTGRPGCGETVDDGITGYVVKERDSQDLIDKIERFIALPLEEKRKMGEAGRRKMEREFDREIIVNAYMEEINRLLLSGNRY